MMQHWKKKIAVLIMAAILAAGAVSCSQIEDRETISENSTSSQQESSSSLPESSQAPTESSEPEESLSSETESLPADETNQSGESSISNNYSIEEERAINHFTTYDSLLITHVGQENFETWMQEQQANGKSAGIKAFIDHFQIDRATLESCSPGLFTQTELDALYGGDEEAIRTAFGLPANYPIS